MKCTAANRRKRRITPCSEKRPEKLVLLLSPFVPHICEEMWEKLGHSSAVYFESWPSYDEDALKLDTVEIVVQINGKVKMKADVDSSLSREALTDQMLEDESVKALIEGKNVVKVIAVPGQTGQYRSEVRALHPGRIRRVEKHGPIWDCRE